MITAVSASDDSVFTNDSVSTAAVGTPDDSGVGAAQDYDKKIYVNTTGDDSNVGSVDSPYATINKGISSVNASDNAVIYLGEGTFDGENNTDLAINLAHKNYNGSLTFIGKGADKTFIDGESVSSIFKSMSADSVVILKDIAFINGKAENGGAITSNSDLTIDNCIFRDNKADSDSAVYWNGNNNLAVVNSQFVNNSASSNGGGGLHTLTAYGNVIVRNCLFDGNSVRLNSAVGVGAYVCGKVVTMVNNTFKNMISGEYAYDAALYEYAIENGTIVNNTFINCTNNGVDNAVINVAGTNYLSGNKFINSTSAKGHITNNGKMNVILKFIDTNITNSTFTLNATVTDIDGNLISATDTFDDPDPYNVFFIVDGVNFGKAAPINGVASLKVTKLIGNGDHVINGTYDGASNASVTTGILNVNIDQTLWVSNSRGNDTTGDGSKDNPYKTISSAISNAADGSGIYIADGNYIESSKITITKSISLIGESNNVNISFSGNTDIFEVIDNDINLAFLNLTFKNINSNNNAIIRIGGSGTFNMDNCNFYNCSGKYGAMQLWTTSTAMINNCNFKNVSASKTAGAGAIYISGSGMYNIYNCLIENTKYAVASGYMYGTIYNYGKGTVNIVNSTIKKSNGSASSVIYNKGTMFIINSTIADNIVNPSVTGYQGESIFYNNGGSLTINSSIISNNSGSNFIFEDKSNSVVTNSVFLDNNYTKSFKDGSITANYNWWGTNDKPNDFVNNWVIMNYTIGSSSISSGDNIVISANFNKYMDTNGNTYDMTDAIADGLNVEFDAVNGNIGSDAVTANGKASVIYNAPNVADDVVYIKSGNLTLNVPISIQAVVSEVIVYVSVSNGDDDNNNGSESSPVKTIARAIKIATAKGESGQIIIAEGIYNESNLVVSGNVSFIGEGNVVIDAMGSSLFTVSYGTIVFDNLNFINAICAIFYDCMSGKPCTFEVYNCNFVNNSGKYSAACIDMVNMAGDMSLIVDNCSFVNSKSSFYTGSGAICMMTVSDTLSINVTNSVFINNRGSKGINSITLTNAQKLIANINNNVFLNDEDGNEVYRDDSEGGSLGSNFNVDYNWWGTNDKAKCNEKVNNWVVMSVDPTSINTTSGDSISLGVNFNHYTDGNTVKELANPLPNFDISVFSVNNTLDSNNVTVVNGIATINAVVNNDDIITLKSASSSFDVPVKIVSLGPKVYNLTNETFFNFFGSNGKLLSFINDGDILNFIGDFANLTNVKELFIEKSISMNGVNAKLFDLLVYLKGTGINMNNFDIEISKEGELNNGIIILGNDIVLRNNIINVTTLVGDEPGYGILVDGVSHLVLDSNIVYFYANGDNSVYSRGIDICDSDNVELTNNSFEFNIPSYDILWDAYYNGDVKSLGIIISTTENFTVANNTIKTKYNGIYKGAYDTIYGMYIYQSFNGNISDNIICTEGNMYSYSLVISGAMDVNTYEYSYCSDVNVLNNNITTHANTYGSWGIQAQIGNGLFANNIVNVVANDAVYGIYTEGMMGPTTFNVVNNSISASANCVWAISSAGNNEQIIGNNILSEGNYTLGIYSGPFGTNIVVIIENNTIVSLGSGVGNVTGQMPEKQVAGIYIFRLGATIRYNNITTSGNHTVLINTKSQTGVTVTDNYLIASNLTGDVSVLDNGINVVKNNLPSYSGIVYVDVNGNDLNQGSIDAPVKTIARAIKIATAKGGSGHIIIGSGLFKEFGLETNKDLIIEGAGSDKTIIDGSQSKEIITNSFASLTLKGISLINAYNVQSSGGAIVSTGNLTLEDVIIKDSKSTNNGGAIYAVGNLIINNSIINNNTASGSGGAIYIDAFAGFDYPSSLIIENSNLSYNVAESTQFGGGAIYMQVIDGCKSISNTIFDSNKANAGGAIFMQRSAGDFIISGSEFNKNMIDSAKDTYGGGAICLIGKTDGIVGNVIITKSKFINNTATTSAGAIFTRNADLSLSKSFIINNSDLNGNGIVRSVTNYYPNGAKVTVEDNWWGNTIDDREFSSKNLNNINKPKSWLILDISYDASNITIGDDVEVTISLNHNQNGDLITGLPSDTVSFFFDGNSKDLDLINGISKTTISITSTGEKDIKAIVEEIVVNYLLDIKIGYSMGISVENITVGENAVINVILPVNATGNVIFTINNNNTETVPVVDGKATLILSDLVAGDYKVTVKYNGNNDYKAINDTVSFVVSKADVTLDVFVDDIVFGEDAVVTVKSSVDGAVVVTVDGVDYNVDVVNGTGSVVVSGLNVGNYSVSATFAGNDNYNVANADVEFNVLNNTLLLSGDDVVLYYKNGTRYIVLLTDSSGNVIANKTLIFNVNGVNYTYVTDNEGKASIAINLVVGEYVITVTSVDDSSVSIVNNIAVLSTIRGDNIVKYFKNGTQYYATFLDANGNPLANTTVSFNINGVFYNKTTDANGVARLNINLAPGKYILTAIHSNRQMFSNNITVLSTIEGNDVVKYFRNGTQYSAKFVDAGGNRLANTTVSFNINGVFYNKTTDANGVARLNINLAPGKYILTATHSNGQMFSNNITVLPVLAGSDLNIKYRDGSKYAVKLVDGTGNPVANKTVQMNINGVFYNKVTDVDGIARLNINLMPGKYIITSMYDKAVTSNTIVINSQA